MSNEQKLDKWTALIIAIIIIAGSYIYVEGKKLDYQKAKDEKKQEKIVENKESREICLQEVEDNNTEVWNKNCKNNKLKNDCALDSDIADSLEKSRIQARNECIKMYPTN